MATESYSPARALTSFFLPSLRGELMRKFWRPSARVAINVLVGSWAQRRVVVVMGR